MNLFPRVSALCALFFLASKRLPCRLSDVKGGLTKGNLDVQSGA